MNCEQNKELMLCENLSTSDLIDAFIKQKRYLFDKVNEEITNIFCVD